MFLQTTVDELLSSDYGSRLDGSICFLDHAGSSLAPDRLLLHHSSFLLENAVSNPHSRGPVGCRTAETVSTARERVLAFFAASPTEFEVVFTSGATHALSLLAAAFDFAPGGAFAYTAHNHNSVLGIRAAAQSRKADVRAVDFDECGELKEEFTCKQEREVEDQRAAFSLFAFPAECNFSGLRFPMDLISEVRRKEAKFLKGYERGNWMVLLDAAKFSASEKLDLGRYKPDFTVISFYKMFGFPTGIGALIIRKAAVPSLRKDGYFGGGSVDASAAHFLFQRPRNSITEFLEAGTLNFASIHTVIEGLDFLENYLGMPQISSHLDSLRRICCRRMKELTHRSTGRPLCKIYDIDEESFGLQGALRNLGFEQGPIIAFSLFDRDGSYIGYHEVENLSHASNIQLRTGCFCNPGACHRALHLTKQDIESQVNSGHVCSDELDLVNGIPTGCCRISFGFTSTLKDIDRWIHFLIDSFLQDSSMKLNLCPNEIEDQSSFEFKIESLSFYPIKSCGGISVLKWPLDNYGRLYLDHKWAIMDGSMNILTQKRIPAMSTIKPSVDLLENCLRINAPGMQELTISLENVSLASEFDMSTSNSISSCKLSPRFFIHREKNVHIWFSKALGRECLLVQCLPNSPNNFANQGDYLLISSTSFEVLRAEASLSKDFNISRLRSNLVVSSAKPFLELKIDSLTSDKARKDVVFRVRGPCRRCIMINIDQDTGERSPEMFKSLAKVTRNLDPQNVISTPLFIISKIYSSFIRQQISEFF